MDKQTAMNITNDLVDTLKGLVIALETRNAQPSDAEPNQEQLLAVFHAGRRSLWKQLCDSDDTVTYEDDDHDCGELVVSLNGDRLLNETVESYVELDIEVSDFCRRMDFDAEWTHGVDIDDCIAKALEQLRVSQEQAELTESATPNTEA